MALPHRDGFLRHTGILVALLGCGLAAAQSPASAVSSVPIWPGVAPGSESWTQKESTIQNGDHLDVRNVVQPSLLVYLPDPAKASGAAVIVVPGSRMTGMDIKREGTNVAEYLNSRGIAAFVLKHRLIPSGTTPEEFQARINGVVDPKSPTYGRDGGYHDDVKYIIPLATEDLRQAIRTVRKNAASWKIAPNRIGVIGFSSGVLLVNGVTTLHDAQSRPDFAAVVHGFTVDHDSIPADAPPLFIACANDDPAMPSTNCADLYLGWRNAAHSAELHIYARGGHMFNMVPQGLPADRWIERFGDWIAVLPASP